MQPPLTALAAAAVFSGDNATSSLILAALSQVLGAESPSPNPAVASVNLPAPIRAALPAVGAFHARARLAVSAQAVLGAPAAALPPPRVSSSLRHTPSSSRRASTHGLEPRRKASRGTATAPSGASTSNSNFQFGTTGFETVQLLPSNNSCL
jgi:hypothetical protein